MLLTVFDYNTVRGTVTPLDGETLLSNLMAGRSSAPFTTFLGKSAVNLGYPRLYDNETVPAPLAPRAGDDGDFETSPATVRQHAMILYYAGEYRHSTHSPYCDSVDYVCILNTRFIVSSSLPLPPPPPLLSAGCPELYDVASTILNNAAENPNAINFYLVAGDYVFIVIGAILSFSVLVLTIIGFVIHPYFLG